MGETFRADTNKQFKIDVIEVLKLKLETKLLPVKLQEQFLKDNIYVAYFPLSYAVRKALKRLEEISGEPLYTCYADTLENALLSKWTSLVSPKANVLYLSTSCREDSLFKRYVESSTNKILIPYSPPDIPFVGVIVHIANPIENLLLLSDLRLLLEKYKDNIIVYIDASIYDVVLKNAEHMVEMLNVKNVCRNRHELTEMLSRM